MATHADHRVCLVNGKQGNPYGLTRLRAGDSVVMDAAGSASALSKGDWIFCSARLLPPYFSAALPPALKVFRPLMNDPDDVDAARADAIDEGVGIAGHQALARPLADARPEHQTKRSYLFGLGQDGVDDAVGDAIPGSFEVVLLYGFEIAPGANRVFKPLSGHGALSGVFRRVPTSHRP